MSSNPRLREAIRSLKRAAVELRKVNSERTYTLANECLASAGYLQQVLDLSAKAEITVETRVIQ